MDGQTDRCLHCGATVAPGPFCSRCGARAGARVGTEPTHARAWSPTDTAERVYDIAPAHVAASPAMGHSAYADSAESVRSTTTPVAPRPAPGPGLWLGAAAALVVMLAVGTFLLVRGTGGDGAATTSPRRAVVPPSHGPSSAGANDSSAASAGPSSSAPTTVGPLVNVAGFSEATAPAHAPAGVDFTGRPVTYVAQNLVDGRNDTCWRTAGDATGMVLRFHLDQPTRLTRVGLVNGYAKIGYSRGRAYDWYLGNRRVLSVDWLFDDGTSVPERFGTDRSLQQIAIQPVTTSVVRLRITEVSGPGTGPAARDDTAISEVLLLGRTTA
jgi:hypothetical protein